MTFRLTGTQLKYLTAWENGVCQWFRLPIASVQSLYETLERFDSLRIKYHWHSGGWIQEVVSIESFLKHSTAQPSIDRSSGFFGAWIERRTSQQATLWVQHSLIDAASCQSILDSLRGRLPDRPIAGLADLLEAQESRRGAVSTDYWEKFHATRRGRLHSMRPSGRLAVVHTQDFRLNRRFLESILMRSQTSHATFASVLSGSLSLAAFRALGLNAPATVQSVFSNEPAWRRRIPGACFAEDVYFETPDSAPDLDSYFRAIESRLLRAYSHGVYDWGRLRGALNACGHTFYRDIGINLLGVARLNCNEMDDTGLGMPELHGSMPTTEVYDSKFKQGWLINQKVVVTTQTQVILTIRSTVPQLASPNSVAEHFVDIISSNSHRPDPAP